MLIAQYTDRQGQPAQVQFATKWAEVTLRQFLAIDASRSIVIALSFEPDKVLQLPDAAFDADVLPHLKFTKKLPEFETLPLPDPFNVTVVIDELPVVRTIRKPDDLGLATYGQKLTIDEELRRLHAVGKLNYIDAALPLLSVYLYPDLSDKPFIDIADTKPYESAILDLSCMVALPLAAFFLQNWIDLTPSGRVHLTLLPEPSIRPFRWWRPLVNWFPKWPFLRATKKRMPSPNTAV